MDAGLGDPSPQEQQSENLTPETLNDLIQSGRLYQCQGRYDEARAIWETTLSKLIFEKPKNLAHSQRVMEIIDCLSWLCVSREEKQAYAKLCESLKMALEFFGELQLAEIHVRLAKANRWLREYANECKHLEQALAVYKNYYGPYVPQVADTLKSLAEAYGSSGDQEKKIEVLERAFAIYKVLVTKGERKKTRKLLKMSDDLADFYERLRKPRKQIRCLNEKLAIFEEYDPWDKSTVATILVKLGNAHGTL